MATCLDLVKREIDDLTGAELDEVLEQMRNRQARLIQNGADASTAAAQAGRDVADMLRAAAAIEKRNTAINYRIRTEALDYIRTTWGDDPTEGVLALLYGSPKARFGSRDSVVAAQSANFRKYNAGVVGELERAGLFDVLRRGEMDRDVARAMWSIDDEQALKRLPPEAVAIAKILRKWQDVARIDGNRHGAWVGKDEHYVTRQTHHPDRIAESGEERWKADILPKLDLDRMFEDETPKDLNEWLHETYLNITTGVRPDRGDATAERMAAFKGPGNLAKRLSQERVFHFRSADDWFDYNAKYGFGNLREAYLQGLHRAAESTGLMQVLGTNPEFNLQAVVTAIRSELSRANPQLLREFDRKTRGGTRIFNGYREVAGLTRITASRNLATVGAGLRVWNTLTGLGGAVISSITDVPVRASAMRYQGQSYLGALAEGLFAPIRRIVSGGGDAERRASLSAIGYFNEVAIGNLAARFSPDESVPGRLQKATHTFFKWNLLGGWQDEMQRSSLEAMGRFFGEVAERNFGELSERTRRVLENFRITDPEWRIIREGLTEESTSGQRFLTPQAVRELPLTRFRELAADRINALKAGLVERLQRRQAADDRERDWVTQRSEKLRERIGSATARLNERLARAGSRHAESMRSIGRELTDLYDHLDTANAYWQSVGDRQPRLGELRAAGISEGRTQRALADLRSAETEVRDAFHAAKDELDESFLEKWIGKQSKLEASLAGREDDAASDRLSRFQQALTEADGQLTARIEAMAGRTSTKLVKLQERISAAKERLEGADAYWQKVKAAMPKPGDMRRAGVDEGRARESAKELKAEARQLTREIEKLQKDLGEEFIGKASDWQDDFTAFAERIDERIRSRAEISARELGGLEPQVNRILNDAREAIADRVQRLYADEVKSAVITPDARTLAFVRQGTQAGTPIGEALRLFWQFKTFGIAVVQRGLLREYYGYDKGRGGRLGMSEIRGLALLMAASTGFGYIAMSAKDLLKGKEPRPVDDWRTWNAAAAQGGGFGIYGDFIFSDASRYGQGFLATAGGPTIGKADQLYQLWRSWKAGDDAAAETVRFAISNTPYNNLFYTRVAADYLFLYELQEAMNPGYLRRMERRVEQENGQQWWLRPSEVVR